MYKNHIVAISRIKESVATRGTDPIIRYTQHKIGEHRRKRAALWESDGTSAVTRIDVKIRLDDLAGRGFESEPYGQFRPTAADRFVRYTVDGKAQLWVGVADDLWKFGKPTGIGGPWKDSEVRQGVPSDPYLMTGFDEKFLTVSSDKGANVTIELDITGTGIWIPFRTFKSADRINISNIRAYWLRAIADRDCKATVQLEYK